MEITVPSPRVVDRDVVDETNHRASMIREREQLSCVLPKLLANVARENENRVRYYKKFVIPREYNEGDLVWKTKFSISKIDNEYGKWSPNCEGPHIVHKKKNDTYSLIDNNINLLHAGINSDP